MKLDSMEIGTSMEHVNGGAELTAAATYLDDLPSRTGQPHVKSIIECRCITLLHSPDKLPKTINRTRPELVDTIKYNYLP
jgi:hypothetical protein